jgi:hypothetical protein
MVQLDPLSRTREASLRKLVCSGFLLGCALLVGSTNASANSLIYDGMGNRGVVTIELNGVQEGPYYAGEINWLWDTAPEGFAEAIYTYCVDPFNSAISPQWVEQKSTEVMIVDGILDPAAGGRAAWLFNTYAPSIRAGGGDIEAAGLQVAIWEAVNDSDNNLAGGDFALVVNSSVWGGEALASSIRDQAQTYLDALFYAPGQFHLSTATWLDATPSGQDQITHLAQPQTPVSEPGTLLLFSFGVPAALIRRRLRGLSH